MGRIDYSRLHFAAVPLRERTYDVEELKFRKLAQTSANARISLHHPYTRIMQTAKAIN